MSRQVLVQMAEAFSLAPADYSGGDRLDGAGLRCCGASDCRRWHQLGGGVENARNLGGASRYLRALAHWPRLILLVPLPGFLPHSDKDDYWSGGHRGALARTLIEELSSR